MQKLFEVSKSLLYSELRCFGIYALPVGFAVETGVMCPAGRVLPKRRLICDKVFYSVCRGLLDSREELICCAAFFQCVRYGFPIALC